MKRARTWNKSVATILFILLPFISSFGSDEDSPFAARRARLVEKAGGEVMILVPSQVRSRQGLADNANFYYLAGRIEPDAVLCLQGGREPSQVLFRRRSMRPGQATPEGAGIDQGLADTALEKMVPALQRAVSRTPRILFPFSDLDFLNRAFSSANPFARAESFANLDPLLYEMRMVKDAAEIVALRKAIDITVEGLREAYKAAEPGIREIDLAAILRYMFAKRSTEDSFLQTASGPNSTNVHFGATERALAAGDMIVFDVGAWSEHYTADISRTIPASGKFSKEQGEIYDLVLRAQKEGCRRLIPGVTFKAVQDEVERILLEGLAGLGLMTDPKSPWQRRLHIQHGFGHGIGLDIHDSWIYHSPRLDKIEMEPGMVMTMEPGLYFPEKRFEMFVESLKGKVPETELKAFVDGVGPIYKRYVNIGVRIEDDVLITENGNEMLSGGVPKEVAEIEKLMKEKSPHNLIK
jgi:Xaa-Pro aminopeptidase